MKPKRLKINLRIKKGLLGFFIFFSMFVFSTIGVNGSYNDDFEDKRVLFISSYSSAFPTFFPQIEGIRDTFEKYPIIVDVEFMDSKRFFNQENLDNFYNSLEYKMEQTDYDLILVSGDNGLNFVVEHQESLFNDIPIVFFGINDLSQIALHSDGENITGVLEELSMFETIQLAVTFNPGASEIVALVDNTVSGQLDLTSFYDEESTFENLEFKSIDLSTMSMSEYLQEIKKLDDNSIVVLLAALRGQNNQSYQFEDSLDLIVNASSQPVYHIYEHGVGDGLLGGKVVSHYVQGQIASEIALQVFKGTPISEIDVIQESPNLYLLDQNILEEYSIDEKLLPKDTVLLNEEITFFEQYTTYIVSAIMFLVIQSIIIITLVVSVRRLSKARRELVINKNQLEHINEELEYTANYDNLTQLYNRHFFENELPKLYRKVDKLLSIILVDVNGLKLINDAFGHLKGDLALKETARILKETLPNATICRIGGDEFAILQLEKTEEEVSLDIKRLHEASKPITIEGVTLSLSLGYALNDTKDKTMSDLFTEAEDWMYREKLNQVPSNRSGMIETIIATINQKDVYSEVHSKRVSNLSARIATLLGLGDNIVNEIKTAGLLHDIGKIIVPIHILNKASSLTKDEYIEMQKHSEIGFRILNSVSSMRDIAQIVFCHHERVDGKGYPRGLVKDQIPIQARIIGVADAIDAMLSNRLYRPKLSKEKCYNELEKNAGTQFCSKVVKVVLENFDEIVELCKE